MHPHKLETADAAFVLTQAERDRILPGFDGDVVEEILRRIRPEFRERTLSWFDGSAWTDGTGGMLVKFGDAELDQLLALACAPQSAELTADERRAHPTWSELHRRCDEVLHYLWDPIRINGIPAARDEYDDYVPQVVALASGDGPEPRIANYLIRVETEWMGLPANPERARRVAEVICSWREKLAEES